MSAVKKKEGEECRQAQVCDIINDISTHYAKCMRTICESLEAASRAAKELADRCNKGKAELSIFASTSNDAGEEAVLHPMVIEALPTTAAVLGAFAEHMQDVRENMHVNVMVPHESFLRTEIPFSSLTRAAILKAYASLSEWKNKPAEKVQRLRKDSAKAFEVEMEENALVDLYESEKARGIPILDDVIQMFGRITLGSTMSIIQTLADAHEKGWSRILKYNAARDMVENHYTELRRAVMGATSEGGGPAALTDPIMGTDETLLSGVLEKKAGKGRHWQARGVVLKPRYMYYFDNQTLKGAISLLNASVSPHANVKKHPFVFIVCVKGREYKFQAKDQYECQQWVRMVSLCCREGERRGGERGAAHVVREDSDVRYSELSGTVASEKVFLSNLESLKMYRFNIQRDGLFCEADSLQLLFGLLDELFSIHASLLTKLDHILKHWPDASDTIGRIFLSALPSLQMYSLYAKTYVNVSATLSKAIASDPTVRRALETMRKKNSSEYSLPDLLMVPLARLDRYVLLLRQFLEGWVTAEGGGGGEGEKGNIEQALKGMSALAVSVEEQLSLEKNVNEVKRVSKMLINYPGSLSEPGRKYVIEATVTVSKRDRTSTEHLIWLFSDVLIFANQRLLGTQVVFVEQIPLAMIHPPKRADAEITFQFEKTQTTMTFQSVERSLLFFEKFSDAVTAARSHRVFGVDLDELFRQPQNEDRDIPEWLEQAMLHVILHSLRVEGIFRISAQADVIKKYHDSLDLGHAIAFDKTADSHAVCGLIKLWLRELPSRLIPSAPYEQLLAALELDDRKKVLRMREVILSLPQPSLFVLQHFVSFMRVVASYSQYSKMTPSNLAIVFGPNIMQPASSLDASVNVVMEEMIVHYDFIFRRVERMRADLKREKYLAMSKAKSAEVALRESERERGPSPSQLSTSSFTSQIHKQGYLTKKGEVRRNWSTRWFVLKYNWLGYYKGPEDITGIPKGSIVLKGCTFTDISDKRSFSFTVHDPRQNRTFFISAKNAQEHSEWSVAITTMIDDVSMD